MADEWITKDYDGGAIATTLSAGISGATTSIGVVSGSGLPDGSGGPFVLVIDRGGSEEKILVDTRSGNTLTVQQRGYDGTAAVAHLITDTVEACIDAHSIKQANALSSVMDSTGSMGYRAAGMSYGELALGSVGLPIKAGASAPEYGQLTPAGIAYTKCRLSKSQTLTSSFDPITGWTEDDDASGFYTSGANAVIPENGLYVIGLVVAVSALNVDVVQALVTVNDEPRCAPASVYSTAGYAGNDATYTEMSYLAAGSTVWVGANVPNVADEVRTQSLKLAIVRIG